MFASDTIEAIVYAEHTSDYDGEMFVFHNAQDKALADRVRFEASQRHYNPVTSRLVFQRDRRLGRKWVNFNPLTPNWTKAGYYNLTTTAAISVSGSFTYGGAKFGIGASLAKGVVINVPANASRYSRLGFEVDVTMKEYVMEVYNRETKQVYHRIPTNRPIVTNTYNVVKYQ